MKLNRLLIPLILILFFSCAKESYDYKLRGNIADAETKAGISNAQVALYQNSSSFWGAPHTDLVATTETDEQGNYGFSFHPYTTTTTLYLDISADSYFESKHSSVNKSDFEQDVSGFSSYKMFLNLELLPIGTLIIKAKNINPYNNSDLLTIYLKSTFNWFLFTNRLSGSTDEVSYNIIVNGNAYTNIATEVTKNNITTHDTDSVYCPKSITTTYYLNY